MVSAPNTSPADVVGDDQVQALAAKFLGGVLDQILGFGGEADADRMAIGEQQGGGGQQVGVGHQVQVELVFAAFDLVIGRARPTLKSPTAAAMISASRLE